MLGLPRASLADLRGGGPAHNAAVVRALLGGATGPVRDIVLLNAAAAIAVADGLGPVTKARTASGDPAAAGEALAQALSEGLARAAAAVDSGAAAALLARWAELTDRLPRLAAAPDCASSRSAAARWTPALLVTAVAVPRRSASARTRRACHGTARRRRKRASRARIAGLGRAGRGAAGTGGVPLAAGPVRDEARRPATEPCRPRYATAGA